MDGFFITSLDCLDTVYSKSLNNNLLKFFLINLDLMVESLYLLVFYFQIEL